MGMMTRRELFTSVIATVTVAPTLLSVELPSVAALPIEMVLHPGTESWLYSGCILSDSDYELVPCGEMTIEGVCV